MDLRPGVCLSVVLDAGLVELQGAGVLRDDAGLVVGVAVLLDSLDLDGDLQVHVVGGGEVLDDLLVEAAEVAGVPLRVETDGAVEADVLRCRGSGGGDPRRSGLCSRERTGWRRTSPPADP